MFVRVDSCGDAAQASSAQIYLLAIDLLLEDVRDKLNNFVRIEISHALLIKTFLNQIGVQNIAQTALDMLRLVIDQIDEFIPCFAIIPRVDLTC